VTEGRNSSSERPDLIQRVAGHPDAVERAFRSGCAIVLPWNGTAAQIACALRTVGRYLSTLPIETSFPGTDGLEADRQSLWVASTGLGQRLHTELADLAHLDGDAAGGVRGLRALQRHPDVAGALSVLKSEIDRALRVATQGLHFHEDLPPACLDAVTVRYRAIRYAPVQREVAGIGVHPDGSVISALITDQPGLTALGGPGWTVRPTPEAGTVVMPGSILTRWSDGALPPTVHAVEIHRGDPAKCTMVGFLNFADGSDVPRSLRLTGREEPFRNKVSEFKNDDMRPDGDLADFYSNRGFVLMEGDRARFRTLTELVARA
jgi:hypothetical protein